ncbi:hypothetical protein GGI04_002325 [Coemansia thaxteri]|nr:hypothetical protein GGI04_002325 [Coemansia thaxteri]
MGQCSRFNVSSVNGLPQDTLSSVLRDNELPELNSRQERLLAVSKRLSTLMQFEVEEVEAAVHATIRYIYYLNLVDECAHKKCDPLGDFRFEYRRWFVRSAYREEEIGLTMEVERSDAMDVNCQALEDHVTTLGEMDQHSKSLKFRISYDLARVYLAQSRFALALKKFSECQRIDPLKCAHDKFGLAVGRVKPSVDEYVTACTTIVQTLNGDGDSMAAAATPTGQLQNLYISGPQSARTLPALVSESDYMRALEHCVTNALPAVAKGVKASVGGCYLSWLSCVHPPLLQYCAKQPAVAASAIKAKLLAVADQWVATSAEAGSLDARQLKELNRQSEAMIEFIASSRPSLPDLNDLAAADATGENQCGESRRATIAEDQLQATQALGLDLTKVPLATVQLSGCYLSGLRLLEREMYRDAQRWFVHGLKTIEDFPEPPQQAAAPVMAQQAEKDKALKSALSAQVEVHEKLASVLYQIEQGTEVDDLAEDIDAIFDSQVPIRFEFLEHLVLVCLRQDNKAVFTRLVSTIATNQKLYQQLPEIHLTLLQIASHLVVARDILRGAGIDISREVGWCCPGSDSSSSCKLLSGEALERLQNSVCEIAALLLKIPLESRLSSAVNIRTIIGHAPQVGARSENEIERFCRMWGDSSYLLLLGSLLSEMLQRSIGSSVCGPPGMCELVAHVVSKQSGDEDMAVDDEGSGSIAATLPSIAATLFDSDLEEGRKNIQHMRDIAFIAFTCVARKAPGNACLWLYFSASTLGARMASPFLALFVEFLSLHTDAFTPNLLEACLDKGWFQHWLPELVRSLVDLQMSGAAAVLHQCAADVNYEAAISLVVQAFEKAEISQRIAEFFWDPNIIEYGQYLGRLPSSPLRIEFPVPSDELLSSKCLILSSFFLWLSGVFSSK